MERWTFCTFYHETWAHVVQNLYVDLWDIDTADVSKQFKISSPTNCSDRIICINKALRFTIGRGRKAKEEMQTKAFQPPQKLKAFWFDQARILFYPIIKVISLNQGVFGSVANDPVSRDFMRQTGEGSNTKILNHWRRKRKQRANTFIHRMWFNLHADFKTDYSPGTNH